MQDFLGQGWRYPPQFNANGGVALADGEENVRQAIWIILGTAKGERVMRPDFGCDIHAFVFEHPNAATRAMMREAVDEALVLCEPRIEVLSVRVETADSAATRQAEARLGPGMPALATAANRPASVLITVAYRIRATNTEYNLVYPFYLAEGR